MAGPVRSRAEQIVVNHGLAAYAPRIGDIVIAFHLFRDPAELTRELADASRRRIRPSDYLAAAREAGRPVAKLRPCLIMAARGNRALAVPLSSKPERNGRHQALHEPDELAACGLDPTRPAYAKVLEAAQYDFPHPIVFPVLGSDGAPTWVAGRATDEMRRQTSLEMSRQKKQGRLETLRDRRADRIPAALAQEAAQINAEALRARRERELRAAARCRAQGSGLSTRRQPRVQDPDASRF